MTNREGLRRTLGLFDATSLGVGAMVGAGIFVITGISAGLAGPAVILSVVLAGIIASFTALNFAELSSVIPKEGGGYEFAHEIISPFTGFMAGWMWLLSNVVAGAAVSIGLASYFAILFPIVPLRIVAVIACLLTTAINIIGIKESSLVNNALVLIKISILCFFIAMGISYLNFQNLTPFMPNGWNGVLQGAAFIFFAYIGFARITTIAEEVKDPRRTIPLAIVLSLGISSILYLSTSFIAVALLNYKHLATSGSPLGDAIKVTGNPLAVILVSIGALAATTSVLLTTVIGVSRVSFAMSRNGELPSFMSNLHPRLGTPYLSILLIGVVMTSLAAFADFKNVIAISNFGSLCYYTIANLSAFLLRKKYPSSKRPFESPFYPLTPLVGIVTCGALLLFLTTESWIAGIIGVMIGGVYYLARNNIKG